MRWLLRNVSCFVRVEHLTNGHFIDWLVNTFKSLLTVLLRVARYRDAIGFVTDAEKREKI
jgi:hypothetical protein